MDTFSFSSTSYLLSSSSSLSASNLFENIRIYLNIFVIEYIRIRIRLIFSNRIYSYSYSVFIFESNIFVFVFGFYFWTEYIRIRIRSSKYYSLTSGVVWCDVVASNVVNSHMLCGVSESWCGSFKCGQLSNCLYVKSRWMILLCAYTALNLSVVECAPHVVWCGARCRVCWYCPDVVTLVVAPSLPHTYLPASYILPYASITTWLPSICFHLLQTFMELCGGF